MIINHNLKMKKFVIILKWGSILIYIILMTAFISFKNKSLVCTDIKVTVTDSLSNRFVTSAEIKKMFLQTYPKLLGSPISEMDFEEMETIVEMHPAVKSCQIFNNAKGIINVEVIQYVPILRVFSGSASFYLDEFGNKIPISDRFNMRTLVVSGSIPTNTSELIDFAKFITKDAFWNAQIEHIYIQRNNEYILAPRVGDHLIQIGKPNDFELKLKYLRAFYKQVPPTTWNDYKVINLKYKDQIVCSRNALKI